jgi:hypothetical protein
MIATLATNKKMLKKTHWHYTSLLGPNIMGKAEM